MAPAIAEMTRDAQALDELCVFGDAFDGTASLIFYGQSTANNGDLATGVNVYLSGNRMLAQVPATTPDGGILAWPQTNAAGQGTPILLNRPEPTWLCSYATLSASALVGDTVCVHGSLLSRRGSNLAWVWITDAAGVNCQFAIVTAVTQWRIEFTCPNLPAGDYQVWVHSGRGGKYGWAQASDLLTITTAAALGLNFAAATKDLIADFGAAVNTPATDAATAINAALAYSYNSGGTVRPITVTVPAGNYYLTTSHAGNAANYPGAVVKFVGQGGGATFQTTAAFDDSTNANSHMMDFGACSIAFQNCTILMQYGPTGASSADMIRAGTWLNFTGCTLDSHWLAHTVTVQHIGASIGPIGFNGGCVVKGAGVYLINKGIISNGTSWQVTNGQDNLGGVITAQTGSRHHIVADNFQHYDITNVALCGTGRILWQIQGSSFAGHSIHAESNTATSFGEINTNGGEKFSSDSDHTDAKSSASVTSATSNTLTATFPGAGANSINQSIAIIGGKGEGQCRQIIGVSGTTYTLDKPWAIIPDATSTAYQSACITDWTIAENNVQGSVDPNGPIGNPSHVPPIRDGVSLLTQNFDAMGYRWNVCHNAASGLQNGFARNIYMFASLVADNTFANCLNAYLLDQGTPKGLVYRRNSGAKGSGAGAAIGHAYQSRATDLVAVDRHNLTDCKIGLNVAGTDGQVDLWGCAFSPGSQVSGSEDISPDPQPVPVNQLNGTSFTGFAA